MKTSKLWARGFALFAMSAFFAAAIAWGQTAGTNAGAGAAAASESPPAWAYPVDPPAVADAQSGIDRNELQRVPDSSAAYTLKQIGNRFMTADWHPAGHPTMPSLVAQGRTTEVYACGYCHLPNGLGRPENSGLAGLPAAYIVQQMADFKSGVRKTSELRSMPIERMVTVETKATDEEIQAAADYFSRLGPKQWIRVVETATVPKTHVSGWMLVSSGTRETEPIDGRIIETPEDVERTEKRDDASGFVAYVPVGSIARGEMLAATGGAGKTNPCASCHGPALRGMGNVPALAGRSPSYVFRQLFDMRNGARAGAGAQLMKPVVANLTVDDMVAIAAYTASLHP